MASLFCDADSQQSWAKTDQSEGFFPEGMSPFRAFQDESYQGGAGGAPYMQLGPRGPLPPMESDDVAMSLIGILATPVATPVATPTPTPVGSPKWGRLSSEITPRNKLFEPGEPGEPGAEPGAAHGAAFLPPEFYLDAPMLPVTPTKSNNPESHKRSRSPQTETGCFLGKACFSLPVKVAPHVNECNVTEAEVQGLGLLEEELVQMMQTIVV